ncbi:MAG: DUF4265 domain-containing protein [Chloroflexota bacterium]|nr:DUF4265 domain-containing protein [Chloroflexota bacterium]
MAESSGLVKILAEDPNSDEGGETFWAKPLGNNLYEIHNIVMFVPGLHPLDVVRCEEVEQGLPRVVQVVRASGYKTIGIIFREDAGATEDQFIDVMWALRQKGCTYEKASKSHFACAIPPDADYQEITDYLQKQEDQGVLYFEDLG